MTKRIVKLIISILYFLMDCIKRFLLRIAGKQTAAQCMVLLYHEVLPSHSKKFHKQLSLLMRYTHPVPAKTGRELTPGKRYTALTFDDGFLCIMDTAVPELLERGIPFSLFIPVNYLGIKPGWEHHGDASTAFTIIREKTIKELAQKDEVIIGSHSLNHPHFPQLPENQVKEELVQSKKRLEDIIGQEVTAFAFPFGELNPYCIQEAQAAGYKEIFSVLPEYTKLDGSEPAIGRIQVEPDDWQPEFLLKIAGAYNWEPVAYRLKSFLKNLLPGRK